jgi:hydrogenase maturation protease
VPAPDEPACPGPRAPRPNRPPLLQRLKELACPSMVVVCVGNEIRTDDAAGVAVARRLAGSVPWKVYNTFNAPESFLMKIASDRPDVVLLVDAFDFAAEPGTIELFGPEQVGGQGPSTHGPAPVSFLDALMMVHRCRQAVLGIQPERVSLGEGLSAPVARAVETVVQAFRNLAASLAPGDDG